MLVVPAFGRQRLEAEASWDAYIAIKQKDPDGGGRQKTETARPEKEPWPGTHTHMALIANRVSLISRLALTWEHRGQVLQGM